MRNIKMKLEFDGSRYMGWQRLGDNDNTIQAKLEVLLSKMTEEEIKIIGSSRTDKGVHALGLVANFFTNSPMEVGQMEEYINRYLPDDIIAYDLEEMDDRFHSRYQAKSKLYSYRLDNARYQRVFTRRYTCHLAQELNIDLMREAASQLIGNLDFQAFTTMKSKKKSTIRNLMEIDIYRKEDYIHIDYRGDGFLHNMIRIITGSLIRVGLGEIKPEYIREILEARDRSLAGPIAEAKGLILVEVSY